MAQEQAKTQALHSDLSDISTVVRSENENGVSVQPLSENELEKEVEKILKLRIQQGHKEAFFQLGQLYFEQVDSSCD